VEGKLTVKWNCYFGQLKKKANKKYHHYNSKRIRTRDSSIRDPLVLCGRYPDELPLLRLPLISHFMLLAFAVYTRKHSGRLGK
jgi:hypothetical protein